MAEESGEHESFKLHKKALARICRRSKSIQVRLSFSARWKDCYIMLRNREQRESVCLSKKKKFARIQNVAVLKILFVYYQVLEAISYSNKVTRQHPAFFAHQLWLTACGLRSWPMSLRRCHVQYFQQSQSILSTARLYHIDHVLDERQVDFPWRQRYLYFPSCYLAITTCWHLQTVSW